LLVKALLKTGQLDKVTSRTLDYDNQVIATEKYDAAKTFKKCQGYQSVIASVGQHIVYIEDRNGNLVREKEIQFYIRGIRCASMEQQIGALPSETWNKIRLGTQEMPV